MVQGKSGGVGWKAFDLLNKMRYVLWVVALLEACGVTNNGRHLGFLPRIRNQVEITRNVNFFMLYMKNYM